MPKEKARKNKTSKSQDVKEVEYSTREYERAITFSMTYCSKDSKFSFYSLADTEAKELIDRLRHFEGNRLQFGILDKRFFSKDKKDSNGYKKIDEEKPDFVLTDNYYHFRSKQGSTFRIFGCLYDSVFFITHIDKNGVIYPKAHK